jgi:methyl-accepting chemotaxis protein
MALLLPLAAAFAGCKSGQTAAPDGSSGSKDSKGRITLSQLNQEMINYSSWQNARALAIANTIETAAPNEQVRYEAIRMKVEILNTQRSLLLAPDPRDIFTDSWVYAIQRRNYLHEGRARDVFGQWRDDISKTNGELIAELKRIGGLFMTPEELAKAEAAVEAYAGEHPSLGAFKAPAARPSADAKKKDKDSSGGLGTIVNIPLAPFSAMHGVDAGATAISRVADVAERLTIVTRDMPEQIRWQAELLQYDVTHRDPFKTTFEDLHTAAESIEQVSRSVQSMPEDVRKQVEDVMSSLDESAKNLQETLHQAQLTADAFTATAGSANQLVQSYGKVFGVADESGAETAPPPDPDAPSDLEQLTTAAEQLGSTVVEARGLVSDLDGLLQDSGTLQTRIEGLTRYAVRQVLILIGAVFVAAALYRVLSSRVIKPR